MIAEARVTQTLFDGWPLAWQATFLRELERTDDVRKSCDLAGIARPTAYETRDRYKSFAIAWDRARYIARRRAGRAGRGAPSVGAT